MYIANLIVCLQEADPLGPKECRKFMMNFVALNESVLAQEGWLFRI